MRWNLCWVGGWVLTASFSAQPVFALELLDNPKLIKLLEAGVPLDVVIAKIGNSECHFDSTADAIVEIQAAAKKGGLEKKESSVLLNKVIELAGRDKKRLEDLVARALNIFDNAMPGAEDDEYAMIRRSLEKEGKNVVPFLLRGLEEESERKRAGVLDTLAVIGDKSQTVQDDAMRLLFDRSKGVRKKAAECVAALKGPGTFERLIQFTHSRQQKLDGVAMALGYCNETPAIEPLTHLLKDSIDSDVRVCAAFALGRMRVKSPAAREALLEGVLDERDPSLRQAAAAALGRCVDPRAPSYIIKAFQRYREGRDELVRNLDSFKEVKVFEFLIRQLNENDDPRVKQAIQDTLRLMTQEKNLESVEDWQAWLDVNRLRPDLNPASSGAPRLPDARGTN